MAEQGKTATVETVADEDLARAWESTNDEAPKEAVVPEETPAPEVPAETPPAEEKKEEQPASEEAEKKPEEKLDHKESSHLGRKVKGLKDQIDFLNQKIEELTKSKVVNPDEVPEIVSTRDDVIRIKHEDDRQKEIDRQIEQQTYEKSYLEQIEAIGSVTDENLHTEIMAELLDVKSQFNVKHSSNGYIDAARNYAKVKDFIVGKKSGREPGLPKRETAVKPPVTPAASSTVAKPKSAGLPKLDPVAQEYVNYLRTRKGYSDEQIAKELAE